MTLGQIINSYRQEHSLSMRAYSSLSGISYLYISMLERGTDQRGNVIAPSVSTIQKVADSMGKSLDWIFGMLDSAQKVIVNDTGPTKPELEIAKAARDKTSRWRKIPVMGRIAAGIPIDAIEDILDYEYIEESEARGGTFFALRIKGNSMEPMICDGDTVIVRQQEDAESGDIVIAQINGNEAACKRLKKYDGKIALVSINPAYEPMFFSPLDVDGLPVRILGRVVKQIRRYGRA